MMTLEQMAAVNSAARAVSNLDADNTAAFLAKLEKTNPDMAAKLADLFGRINAGTFEYPPTDDDGDLVDEELCRPMSEGDAEAWGYA